MLYPGTTGARGTGLAPYRPRHPYSGGPRRAGGTIRIVARRGRGSGRAEILTVSEREALGVLTEQVADLRREVGALTAGMAQLVVGQEAHTALLQALLSAVTELGEEGGSDGLAEALGRIADSLDAIPAAVAASLDAARAA